MNSAISGKKPGVARKPGRLTMTVASIQTGPAPRLPHEEDESAASQGGKKRKKVQQAAADIKRGLKDTDRGEESNSTYQKLK